jgi:hypothetical protein
MWDWFSFDCDEGEAEDIDLDFDPITRTKDPLADNWAVEGDSEGDGDLYENEDELFANKARKYLPDKEMEIGFPDEQQEYEAKPCLEDVLDEFEGAEKGRQLKKLKKGFNSVLYGDPSFFDDSDHDE